MHKRPSTESNPQAAKRLRLEDSPSTAAAATVAATKDSAQTQLGLPTTVVGALPSPSQSITSEENKV